MRTCKRGHVRLDSEIRCIECNKEIHRIRYAKLKDDPDEIRKRKEYWEANKERINKLSRERGRRGPKGRQEEYARAKKKRPYGTAWRSMIDRCENPSNEAYRNYGARGIKVCDRWMGKDGYKNFVLDMGPKPTRRHSVDRRNNNLGYSPNNCYWATKREQAENTRNSIIVTLGGRTQCLSAWARELGISSVAFKNRMKRGWPEDRMLKSGSGYATKEQRLERAIEYLMGLLGDREYERKIEIQGLLRGE